MYKGAAGDRLYILPIKTQAVVLYLQQVTKQSQFTRVVGSGLASHASLLKPQNCSTGPAVHPPGLTELTKSCVKANLDK